MQKHIAIIASDYKGTEFIEECHHAGWHVTLVTRKKLLDSAWPWTAINDAKTVDDEAGVMDYVRAVTNLAGSRPIDRVVGLDEFDVLTAAMTREHLDLRGHEPIICLAFSRQTDDAKYCTQCGHSVSGVRRSV